MDKLLKISVICGVIFGVITGIVLAFVCAPFIYSIGLNYWWLPPPPNTPFMFIALVEITVGVIFGIAFGIIYSKAYSVIPGKCILKALIFGLFYYAMFNLRFVTIEASYGRISIALIFIISGLFILVPFVIVFGLLYEFLKDRYNIPEGPKIVEYNMREGILPAAIAGLLGGIATFGVIVVGLQIAFWQWIPEQLTDIEFLISQLGGQTFFHLIWCTVMGTVFPKVYNLVPGKGVLKGICYGLIAFLIFTEGRLILAGLIIGYHFHIEEIIFGMKQLILLGGSVWIVFGIVLGYLYRKPSD